MSLNKCMELIECTLCETTLLSATSNCVEFEFERGVGKLDYIVAISVYILTIKIVLTPGKNKNLCFLVVSQIIYSP